MPDQPLTAQEFALLAKFPTTRAVMVWVRPLDELDGEGGIDNAIDVLRTLIIGLPHLWIDVTQLSVVRELCTSGYLLRGYYNIVDDLYVAIYELSEEGSEVLIANGIQPLS